MKSKKIGNDVWTTENLAIGEGEKGVYRNPDATPEEGLLYTWDAAMRLCPEGWHLPSNEEWDDWEWNASLKQRSSFASVLAGYRNTDGTFGYRASYAGFWSSSESGTNAWYRYLFSTEARVHRTTNDKAYGFSVILRKVDGKYRNNSSAII